MSFYLQLLLNNSVNTTSDDQSTKGQTVNSTSDDQSTKGQTVNSTSDDQSTKGQTASRSDELNILHEAVNCLVYINIYYRWYLVDRCFVSLLCFFTVLMSSL